MRRALAACLLLLVTAGCEEAIAPPPDLGAYYTLWGALDPSADVQALRVVEIAPEIGTGADAPLGATLTVTDLQTGAVTTGRDSVVAFANGTFGHVVLIPLRPSYGGQYEVRVVRDADGATTRAVVNVPARTEPVRLPIETNGTDVTENLLWPGVAQLNAVRVRFLLENGSCDRATLDLAYTGTSTPSEFGWRTDLDLREAAREVAVAFQNRPHALVEVTVSGEVASADWRVPGGVFDPEVVVEPGVFTNVEAGFGFVGSAYRTGLSWAPNQVVTQRAGFRTVGFGGCI